MSRTVDDRVVEMRFDNKQFENNVQTSIHTLDKLKKSLDLSGAAKGLENVDKAARGINLSGIESAVETVKSKFSALEVVGITALANITNSAVNTGKQLIASLSIDQITAGWDKYGQKTASVQTIMNATGKSIDEVNGYLDKLMWFSDETSYGFTDMTAALGQLTSAGGDIDKLIPMITGIANATAYAGKGSSEFSRAIYNLNQSYSAGSLQYMDWKSLELAGVASKELKQTFIDTGIAMGKIKEGEVTIANFGQTLKDKWADTSVMEAAFGKFGEMTEKAYQMVQNGEVETASEAYEILAKKYDGVAITAAKAAQEAKTFQEAIDATKDAVSSGWMKTFELIFGNYEEAKELWTDLANSLWDAFASGAEARNEMLSEWKELGGRDDLIESFWNVWDSIASIIKPIKEAFRDIFPPMTAKRLAEITKNLKEFTAKLILSDSTSDKLKRTFKGLFAVLNIIKQAFSAVFKAISPLFGGLDNLGGGILGITAGIGDWLVKLNELIQKTNIFNKVAQVISKGIKILGTALKTVIDFIKEKIVFPGFEAFHAFLGRVQERMSGLGKVAEAMRDGIIRAFEGIGAALERGSFFKFLQTIWKVIVTIGTAIGKLVGKIVGGITDKLGNANFSGILDFINTLTLSGIAVLIAKFVKGLKDIVNSVGSFKDSVIGILDSVRGCFEAYQTQLKAGTLMTIAKAIALLVAAILVLSFIDSDKLDKAITAITFLFAELLGAMGIFTKISGKFSGVSKACTAMVAMSVAVLILAGALKKLSSLSWEGLATGLLGVAGLMGILIGTIKLLNMGGKGAVKGATQMILFAVAVKILASVCEDLANLSWEELGKGLLGVGALLAGIAGFLKLAKFSSKSISTATGIVILAAAIKILASACEDFASMSWEGIGKGLTSIAILLAAVLAFTRLSGNAKHVISTGLALIAIAAAMKIFASAAKDMAQMSWEGIAKGLTAMAVSLLAVTIALRLMPKSMISTGLGLIAVAAALSILASVLSKLGGMTWESIGKGLVTLGGAILILSIGLNAMKGTLAGSAAMLIATVALAALAPILAFLGAMSWQAIAKGLVAIAGAFTIIGIAGYALAPAIPAILGLAGAMALIGVAVLAFGAGIAALGVGLTALSAGIAALDGSLVLLAKGIVLIVQSLIIGVIDILEGAIVSICEAIANSAVAIGEAVKAIVLTLIDVLVECIPPLADGVLKLVAGLLEALVDYTPQIVDALFQFVIKILEGLGRNTPALIKAIVDLLTTLFQGAIDALMSIDPEVFLKGSLAIAAMAAMIAALSAIASLIPGAMIGVLGVIAVLSEFGAIAQLPGISWLISEGGELLQKIGEAIGGFVGGIVGGFMGGMSNSFPTIAENLSAFMTNLQPFLDGVKTIDASSLEGVNALVKTIMALTAANLLERLTSWLTGGSSLAQFGEDIASFGPSLKAYSDSVAGIDPEAIKASADAAKTLAEMASVIPNEGGVVSWFAGDNSIAKFAPQLPILGNGLKGFSDSVTGIVPENIIAAANAAKVLAEMTAVIPNEGGVVSWFAGENSISKFAGELICLGGGLKGFSDAIVGIVPENLVAAANAAKALAEMTAVIPNEGGVASWFAGENSISKFGSDLIDLGTGLKGFSDKIVGISPENLTAAANAAKALADMTNAIPNEGGIKAWFVGEASISKFAGELVTLGGGLKGFSDSVTGIVPENLVAASNAAKALAEMTATIPNEGGIKAWFVGESSISNFADKLPTLGGGLKGFSDSVAGIVPENVMGAANAAKALAEMTSVIPKEGGIKAWFSGKSGIATFADKLPTLGKALKGFSDSVAGISPENVTAAASAAKSLGDMTATIPKNTDKIEKFGGNLEKFGDKLASYFKKTKEISAESVSGANSAIKSIKDISNVNSGNIKSVAKAIDEIVKSVKGMAKITKASATNFKNALTEVGKTSSKALLKPFENIKSDMEKAGKNAIGAFVDGVKSKNSAVESAAKGIAKKSKEGIEGKKESFKTAGKNLVEGFADGIDENAYKAEARAKAMAQAAVDAVQAILKEHSPSKVGYDLGDFFGVAFVNAIGDYEDKAYNTSAEMATSAKSGLRDSLKKIKDIIDGNIDTQPTIRPVLDLSNVKAGAGAINDMLNLKASVGTLAKANSISTMMNRRNQNGSTEEVVSAINKLRKDLGNVGNTYTIGDITYDDGSSISDAVQSLVRAARVERRT